MKFLFQFLRARIQVFTAAIFSYATVCGLGIPQRGIKKKLGIHLAENAAKEQKVKDKERKQRDLISQSMQDLANGEGSSSLYAV